MNSSEFSARARLFSCLDRFLSREITACIFAATFESIYNLEIKKEELNPVEAIELSALFEKVAWYSPFKEDRENIPHYVGDDELYLTAKIAQGRIQGVSESQVLKKPEIL